MKGIEIRHKIFSAYAKNLQFVAERYNFELGTETEIIDLEKNPIYICPLCLKAFSEELLNQNFDNNPLTMEHLPPKSVGGNPKILTCKDCNSKSGNLLDKSIPESLRTESFLKRIPGSSVSSLIGINKGKKFRALTKIGNEGQFLFQMKSKDNPIMKNQIDSLKTSWNNSTIEFTFSYPQNSTYFSSLIRIGLLLSFYYFGYRILFEKNYHRIRNYVIDKNNNKLPHNGVIIFPDNMKIEPGLHLLVSPDRYRSYFVIFDIDYEGLRKIIGTPIPGPGKVGWEKYENFKDIAGESNVNLKNISSRDYVSYRQFANAYDYIYKNY